MGLDQQRLSPAERANLVAYLDGELNEAESRAIATKLTQSQTARRELEALEKTWELLEHLPRPQPSPQFTQRTLTQVQLLAQRDDQMLSVAGMAARRVMAVLVLFASAALTVVIAYVATRWVWPDRSARLIRDLTLAEHLDEYQDVGSWQFLQQLDQSPQLSAETARFVFDQEEQGPEANKKRLLAMPREERQALSKNLERYDALDRATQRSLNEIDSELAKSSREDRTRYLSLLREYHLWREGLPEAEQKELAGAAGDQKLELIGKYESKAKQPKAPRDAFRRAQFALLSPISITESAHILGIWLKLPPEKRNEIEKTKGRPVDFMKKVRDMGAQVGIVDDPAQRKAELAAIRRHVNKNPRLQKELEALKDQDASKGQGKAAHPAWRLAEALYYLENEPARVSPAKLEQFDAALPTWFRDQIDPLPPEGARRRLAVLYRLIYPAGSEMPDAPKAKGAPASPPVARPTPPRRPPAPASNPF